MLGMWHHLIHLLAICCILFPVLIFHKQTSRIALEDFPDAKATAEIRERFDGQVMVVGGSGGASAYVSNNLDQDEVAKVIFGLDPSVKPTNTEQDGAGQPPTRRSLNDYRTTTP